MFILIDVPMQIIRSLVLIMCCDAVVSAPEGQLWYVSYFSKALWSSGNSFLKLLSSLIIIHPFSIHGK